MATTSPSALFSATGTNATIAPQPRAPLPAGHPKSARHNASKMRELHHPKSVIWTPAVSRTFFLAMVFAIVTVVVNTLAVPTASAQYCEIVGCWTECRPEPGGRHCRRFCQRRCWRPAQRYGPEPDYRPRYVPAATTRSYRFNPTPVLLALGALAIITVVAVAASISERAAMNEVHRQTDEAEYHAAQAAALTDRATATADEIDRYIDAELKDAYAHGRNSSGSRYG